jgi:hypothetical protein
VAAWTAFYKADLVAAREQVLEMKRDGLPKGRWGEWLGANLALLPPESRCAHWGDKATCPGVSASSWRPSRRREGGTRLLRRSGAAEGHGWPAVSGDREPVGGGSAVAERHAVVAGAIGGTEAAAAAVQEGLMDRDEMRRIWRRSPANARIRTLA